MTFNLILVSCFFCLSLVGAVVLFKFFQNTAVVKTKQVQAGGAIAGFIIIFMLLTYCYEKIKNDTEEKLRADLKSVQQELEEAKQKLAPDIINGVIVPYENDATIVLAVQQTDPDMQGKFKFSAPCVDPDSNNVKLYLISPTKFRSLLIDSKQSMKNISFPSN